MDPADGAAPSLTSGGRLPAQSGARVMFLPGERPSAERIARRLFCRPLKMWEYAGLAGAGDDAVVEVGASGGRLYIELGGPAGAMCRAYYYVRRSEAQLVMINDGFQILCHAMRRHGLGRRIFQRQVATAAALGIARIELVAGRHCDEHGYYCWPRFGFEGRLPGRLRRMLPIGLEHASTVLDLMECQKGRQWWREHGVTIRAAFDLATGSRSRATWERYVRTKMNVVGGPKTNLENPIAMAYGDTR
jgi:hypothetical protein